MTFTKEQIIQQIQTGQPISIVRAGDGEGIILNAIESVSALKLATEAVLYRQLGFHPTVPQIEAIRQNLIDTYNNCDVIGVPMHKQDVGKHWKKVEGILYDNCTAAILKPKCDIDLAYQMLDDNSYDRILQNRRVLNYVSCRDLDEGFKNKWNIGTVNKYTIAPEAKFTSGYDGEVHYPTQFNKIQRWMDVQAQNFPGSLMFIGAGVIGKIYCNWWRDRGGIAMDVGGVMDCWAGRVTRGPERGLDKEDLTHKL